jgi:hypothetical protein
MVPDQLFVGYRHILWLEKFGALIAYFLLANRS